MIFIAIKSRFLTGKSSKNPLIFLCRSPKASNPCYNIYKYLYRYRCEHQANRNCVPVFSLVSEGAYILFFEVRTFMTLNPYATSGWNTCVSSRTHAGNKRFTTRYSTDAGSSHLARMREMKGDCTRRVCGSRMSHLARMREMKDSFHCGA